MNNTKNINTKMETELKELRSFQHEYNDYKCLYEMQDNLPEY